MADSINAIIVDDEFQSRNFLSKLIAESFSDVRVVGQASDIDEAFVSINDLKPELVFLDVMMQRGQTGFDLFQRFDKIDFQVVFTTAHDEFALKAIKYNALDYLLKPIDLDDLEKAIMKAKETLALHKDNSETESPDQSSAIQVRPIDRITVPTAEGFVVIQVNDILYCQSIGNYTEFHLKNNRKLVSSYTLKQYHEMLADLNFFRAHKSFLINLAHVGMYKRGDGGTIVMTDNREIELARRNKEAFMRIFKGQ